MGINKYEYCKENINTNKCWKSMKMSIEKRMSTRTSVGKQYERVLKERDVNTNECWKAIWTSIKKFFTKKKIDEC